MKLAKEISELMYNKALRGIWHGEKFAVLRNDKKEKRNSCEKRVLCQDGCRLGLDIDLC